MALKVQRVPMIASLVVLCLNSLVCSAADDQDLKAHLFRGGLGFTKIVAARRHLINPGHIYSPHLVGFRPGGGLCVLMLSPVGIERKQIVSSPNGMTMDCSLSFDSTEVFFSWKRNRSATYQIYRVGIDGSDLRQLTDGPCHNFNPCELPDGNSLTCHWWHYVEAGSCGGMIQMASPETRSTQLAVPKVDRPYEIHIILEVTDDGDPPLTSYRRILFTVRPAE